MDASSLLSQLLAQGRQLLWLFAGAGSYILRTPATDPPTILEAAEMQLHILSTFYRPPLGTKRSPLLPYDPLKGASRSRIQRGAVPTFLRPTVLLGSTSRSSSYSRMRHHM